MAGGRENVGEWVRLDCLALNTVLETAKNVFGAEETRKATASVKSLEVRKVPVDYVYG